MREEEPSTKPHILDNLSVSCFCKHLKMFK